MKKLITQPGPHGIKPLPIVDDAPKVTLPTVKLSSPPNYTMGEKVRKREREGKGTIVKCDVLVSVAACHSQGVW